MTNLPFPTIWDNTMRMSLRSCPRKFFFFLQGYDYASRPPFFVWGEAWHEILRKWYAIEHSWDNQDPDYWTTAQVAINAGLAIWDEAQVEERNMDKRANLEVIFMSYLAHYPAEQWKLIELGAETGWIWPVKGTPYELGGALDARIEWEDYGTLPREDKSTASYLSDSFVSQWYYSPQVLSYIWYESQLTGGDSCLVNMATKNVPGPRSNWNTPRFHRIIVQADQYILEEHIEGFLHDIEYGKQLWDRNYFPKTPDPTNCVGGIGKSPCLFKDYCRAKAGRDGWMKMDLSQFSSKIIRRKEAWEPWKRGGLNG